MCNLDRKEMSNKNNEQQIAAKEIAAMHATHLGVYCLSRFICINRLIAAATAAAVTVAIMAYHLPQMPQSHGGVLPSIFSG